VNQDPSVSLDERIRRSLTPLGGDLRIDAFLAVVARERARTVSKNAPPDLRDSQPMRALDDEPGASTAGSGKVRAIGVEADRPTVEDSSKIRAEVDSFMRRDERNDATDGEVADYLESMGRTGFNPEDLPE